MKNLHDRPNMNRIDVFLFSLINIKGFSVKIHFKMFKKLNYMERPLNHL